MRGREHLDGLDDEIRDHLEREAQDNIDRGMTPEAARAAAYRKFGNVAIAKEDARGVWIPVWIDRLLQDARYGLRMLRRSPSFGAVIIAILSLGIGMNTAVFSVVNAVLLQPLSYPHADRVVWVTTISPGSQDEHVAAPDYLGWSKATSLERLVAYDILDDRISRGDIIAPARVAMVSDDFWELSGARPAVGRVPAPGEAAVMLSHAFFERSFASEPDVVGQAVTIDGQSATVAGVLPPGFHVQLPPPPAWAALAPKEIDVYRVFIVSPPQDGRVQLMRVLALLKPDVSLETARAELETIRSRVARENPGIPPEGRLHVIWLADKLVGPARTSLLVLFAAVVLVLLIACANIANLLLARSSVRQREIAIRTAVGASRGRVVRQFLVESLLFACAGAAGGVLVAQWALQVMLQLIPHALPRLTETTVDARVLAFALTTFGGDGSAVWIWTGHCVVEDEHLQRAERWRANGQCNGEWAARACLAGGDRDCADRGVAMQRGSAHQERLANEAIPRRICARSHAHGDGSVPWSSVSGRRSTPRVSRRGAATPAVAVRRRGCGRQHERRRPHAPVHRRRTADGRFRSPGGRGKCGLLRLSQSDRHAYGRGTLV
jgi:hypothetical protein